MADEDDGTADRISVQGISFVPGAHWKPASPLDPQVTDPHGVYLVHDDSGLPLNVRSYGYAGGRALLLDHLREQQWASAPFDVIEREVGCLQVVAGTFLTKQHNQRVREWFLSDGTSGANAALCLFPANTSASVLVDCDALIDSIRFSTRT